MNIVQTFYDEMASHYHKLFQDWNATTREQAVMLDKLFGDRGFDRSARILDCACGIGTQALGLAALGYSVTASDISEGALNQARQCAVRQQLPLSCVRADFCSLQETFPDPFEIVIAMDNALPHMLSREALRSAIGSIVSTIADGGLFVASIRDYDALLLQKPSYSPPYIHKTSKGQQVSFQTWHWEGDLYNLVQYILDDGDTLQAQKFECTYRATTREELTDLLLESGCRRVKWLFPEETGFYQPIVIAEK